MSILYADGGVIGANPSSVGGTWAYVLVHNDDETILEQDSGVITLEVMETPCTNNQMEFYAILRGMIAANPNTLTMVCSDSNVSLGRFFKGWSITNIPEWMLEMYRGIKRMYHTNSFTGAIKMKYTLIDGHPTLAQLKSGIGKRGHQTSKWNVLVDRLCNDEAHDYQLRMK
jgi:ribonuclease HI